MKIAKKKENRVKKINSLLIIKLKILMRIKKNEKYCLNDYTLYLLL